MACHKLVHNCFLNFAYILYSPGSIVSIGSLNLLPDFLRSLFLIDLLYKLCNVIKDLWGPVVLMHIQSGNLKNLCEEILLRWFLI